MAVVQSVVRAGGWWQRLGLEGWAVQRPLTALIAVSGSVCVCLCLLLRPQHPHALFTKTKARNFPSKLSRRQYWPSFGKVSQKMLGLGWQRAASIGRRRRLHRGRRREDHRRDTLWMILGVINDLLLGVVRRT